MVRAEAALAKLALGDKMSQKSVERAVGYCVRSALKSKQDAEKKIGELKARASRLLSVQDSPVA